jgi:hypothetical protein
MNSLASNSRHLLLKPLGNLLVHYLSSNRKGPTSTEILRFSSGCRTCGRAHGTRRRTSGADRTRRSRSTDRTRRTSGPNRTRRRTRSADHTRRTSGARTSGLPAFPEGEGIPVI